MFELEKVVRPRILQMKPYSSARDEFSGEASVYLDANENPFGAIPNNQPYNRYPHPLQPDLKAKISEVLGFLPETIFLGNGSDEAIDLLIRIFCEPNQDEIMIAPPTYGMYAVSAEINSVAVREVLLLPDFQLDTETMLQQVQPNTKIIFLCSPNNPTGNLLKTEDIEIILRRFAGIVVVDEAYIDFSLANSWAKRLAEFPNLVILRTFSKAWGMAALRVGMAIASPAIIHLFNKVKPPYNLNVLTQNYLLEALDHYEAFKETTLKTIVLREVLMDFLSKFLQIQKVYVSHANFILVKVVTAPQITYQRLLEKGVVVRDRSKQPLCDNCLRISVGTMEEIHKLMNGLYYDLDWRIEDVKAAVFWQKHHEKLEKRAEKIWENAHKRYVRYSVMIDRAKKNMENRFSVNLLQHMNMEEYIGAAYLEKLEFIICVLNVKLPALTIKQVPTEKGRMITLKDLDSTFKEHLDKLYERAMFEQYAIYQRFDFSTDMKDHFFAGNQFMHYNPNPTLTSTFDEQQKNIENTDDIPNPQNLMEMFSTAFELLKSTNEDGTQEADNEYYPELRKGIEAIIGEGNYVYDFWEFGGPEFSLFWSIRREVYPEVMKKIKSWFEYLEVDHLVKYKVADINTHPLKHRVFKPFEP